jgi:hypothetical protein
MRLHKTASAVRFVSVLLSMSGVVAAQVVSLSKNNLNFNQANVAGMNQLLRVLRVYG